MLRCGSPQEPGASVWDKTTSSERDALTMNVGVVECTLVCHLGLSLCRRVRFTLQLCATPRTDVRRPWRPR